MSTLQRYIFKELSKTFALTAIALTGVLSTCGGIYNITTLDNLTFGQMLLLQSFIIPMFAAFALPLALLFSATITYGRMATDNEFTACSAGGINILRLLMPCVAIGLFTCTVTFTLFNVFIPTMFSRISQMQRLGIQTIMEQKLNNRRSMDFKENRLFARELIRVPKENEQDAVDAFVLKDVAFIKLNESSGIELIGVADSAAVKINTAKKNPEILADLSEVHAIDLLKMNTARFSSSVGPTEIPLRFGSRVSFMNLIDLLQYWRTPQMVVPRMAQEFERFRTKVTVKLILGTIWDTLEDTGAQMSLTTQDDHKLTVSARISDLPIEQSLSAQRVDISEIQVDEIQADGSTHKYTASAGYFAIRQATVGAETLILGLTRDVWRKSKAQTSAGQAIGSKTFEFIRVPEQVQADLKQLAEQEYLDPTPYTDMGLEKQHAKLIKTYHRYRHAMLSEVNVRTVYSLSVIGLALLGAALGIMFRGGQVLVAFFISFVPTTFVILMNVIGKQIAKGPDDLIMGLGLMWSGLVIIVAIDFVVLKKWLPR